MARIVVADDSWLSRKIAVGILESEGHEVFQAANGREALELVRREFADCLLLDLLMPEMDGFEVLAELQSDGLGTPVIVQTADIQKTTRERCDTLGASEFLNKPVDENALRAAVSRALDGGRGSGSNA